MAEVSDYPSIVRRIVEEYAQFQPSVGEITTELIIDEVKGHYEILRMGWLNGHRVHGTVLHIDLRDGKFWIQQDGTEHGIASELEQAGVPRDHIVLAFKPPEMRKYTDYAVS